MTLANERVSRGIATIHVSPGGRIGNGDWRDSGGGLPIRSSLGTLFPVMMARVFFFVFLMGAVTTLKAEPGATHYNELYRPQFHFSPAKNWMNDPNGMVYYEGEYHLFYQYNPFGDKWGHMSWGHAVSRDLVHWEHLPLALAEENHVMIFSGSAVIDWKNTSGFGSEDRPPMVAIYTGHHTDKKLQDQRLAYSTDKGRTWTKYAGNPVIDIGYADFRDPKVFWHEDSAQWVMIVTLSMEKKLRLYGSPNLKDWEKLSDFGPRGCTQGVWECPDLFPLPVEGGEGSKWVIILNIGGAAPAGGSGCQYFVGDFDGETFHLHEESMPAIADGSTAAGLWADYGRDFYAAVSWSDVPASDGRRLWLGWMSNWNYAQDVPTSPWRSAMTVPRSLSLREVDGKYRLLQEPAGELAGIRVSGSVMERPTAGTAERLIRSLDAELLDIELTMAAGRAISITRGTSGSAILHVDEDRLRLDRRTMGETSFHEKFPGVHEAPLRSKNGLVTLRLLIDRSSIEVFANGGESVISDLIFTETAPTRLGFSSSPGIVRLGVYPLRSIWR